MVDLTDFDMETLGLEKEPRKVSVVLYQDSEDFGVAKVFSTKERAEEWTKTQSSALNLNVVEMEVEE